MFCQTICTNEFSGNCAMLAPKKHPVSAVSLALFPQSCFGAWAVGKWAIPRDLFHRKAILQLGLRLMLAHGGAWWDIQGSFKSLIGFESHGEPALLSSPTAQ